MGIGLENVSGSKDKIYIVESTGSGACFFDYDGDGFLDLYVVNGANLEQEAGTLGGAHDVLYLNRGDGTFVERTEAAGLSDPRPSVSAAFGDLDGDGYIDLFVTNFQNDTNTFYLNLGGGEYEEVTERVGLGAPSLDYRSWGTHFADLDNDGDADLFVASGHVYPQVAGEPYAQRNQVFENYRDDSSQTKWRELEDLGPGLESKKSSRGTTLGDFDNDGWLDIVKPSIAVT